MKVSELAAELKRQNKEIISKAAELGIDAKGATKNLSDAEADKIRGGFNASAAQAAEEKKARLMPRRIAKADVEEAERARLHGLLHNFLREAEELGNVLYAHEHELDVEHARRGERLGQAYGVEYTREGRKLGVHLGLDLEDGACAFLPRFDDEAAEAAVS